MYCEQRLVQHGIRWHIWNENYFVQTRWFNPISIDTESDVCKLYKGKMHQSCSSETFFTCRVN